MLLILPSSYPLVIESSKGLNKLIIIIKIFYGLPPKKFMDLTFQFIVLKTQLDMEEELIFWLNKFRSTVISLESISYRLSIQLQNMSPKFITIFQMFIRSLKKLIQKWPNLRYMVNILVAHGPNPMIQLENQYKKVYTILPIINLWHLILKYQRKIKLSGLKLLRFLNF